MRLFFQSKQKKKLTTLHFKFIFEIYGLICFTEYSLAYLEIDGDWTSS